MQKLNRLKEVKKKMNKDIDQKECEDIELKELKFSLKTLQK